jgi:probable F420-dependent oxidoreductase
MRFWQSVAFLEAEHLLDVARAAEAVGFDGVFVSDHVFFPGELVSRYPYNPDGVPYFDKDTPWLETFSGIAAMAAVTTRLRFVTGVYILSLRHPLEVAKAAATVALLSNDRLALGVGTGWMREEFDVLGREFAGRGRRMDEQIEVMRKVWRGGLVEHAGRHYRFPPLQMTPAPRAPVPILIGGASERALRRAAYLGNGWVGAGNTPDEIPGIAKRLRELRAEAGRERTPFELIVALTTPPDVDVFRRLEDLGVTGVVSWPLVFSVGPGASIGQKRQALETYASSFIASMR